MTGAASSRQVALTVFGTALLAFLMCAATSSIVTQASSPDARELDVAANSIAAEINDAPVTSAPAGSRVPLLLEVPASGLAGGDPVAPEGVKTAPVGIVEETSDAFAQQLENMGEEWVAVEADPAKRTINAAIAAGTNLRKRGFVALILPDQFMGAAPNACNITLGLEEGGIVPVIRLSAASTTDFARANGCLNRMKNRNPTAYVDAVNRVEKSVADAMKGVTSIVETTESRVSASLGAGAAILLIQGMTREGAIGALTAEDSSVPPSDVLDAARRAADWIAAAPTPGVVPATTAAAKKKQEREELKLQGQKKIERAKSDPQNDPDEAGRGGGSERTGGTPGPVTR